MTTSLTMTARAKLEWLFQQVDSDLGNVVDNNFGPSLSTNYARSFTSGTGLGSVNQLFVDRRTVSLSSATDDLDLAGGLTNRFGETVTFKEIKLLFLLNLGITDTGTAVETEGADLLVGGAGAAAHAWASWINGNQDAKIPVRSGGHLYLMAPNDGYSVTPGLQDVLRIVNNSSAASGGDIDYFILLAGVQ